MVTTDAEATQRKVRWLGGIALAVGAIALAVILVMSLRTPPQMGPDDDVFETVDALYTAVRNRDDTRMSACEAKLNEYRAAGKLPASAADSLTAIVAQARGGGWDSAARRLYDFMAVQKREGAQPPMKPKLEKGKKSKSGWN